jgi:hypothetical protein
MQITSALTRIRLATLVALLVMTLLLIKADRAIIGAINAATMASEALKFGSARLVSAPGGTGLSIGPCSTNMKAALPQMAGCTEASFTQPASSPVGVGTTPVPIAVGDFNGDGKPDFAVANNSSNNVTILLGNGSGGFLQAASSPVGAGMSPSSVAVGDFNIDGKPDLAVANNNSNDVTILLGNGIGGFAQPIGSPVGAGNRPISVAVSDFNLDGSPDLAVGNISSNDVTILLGNGSGGFSPSAGSPVGVGDLPRFVAVGDFNLDGKPDLAVTNGSSGNVTILLGNGSGGFSQPAGSPVSAGNGPQSVAVSDFNHDGKLDLAVANFGSNDVTILLGNGMGSFSQPAGSPVGAGSVPRSVTAGDFNLDGNPDLAVADSNFLGTLTILLGNGTGGFSQPASSPFSVGNAPQWVAASDFNLDGKPDLAVVNASSNNVTILLNTCTALPCGNTNFMQPAGSPVGVGGGPNSVAVADFNSDGRLDLATSNIGNASILLGNGMGGFSGPTNFAVPSSSVAVGDFNLDGRLDLALSVPEAAFYRVAILLGDGLGGFSGPNNFAVGQGPLQVAVGDFNRDGRPDLVTANFISHNVSVLLGNGVGGFSAATDFATGLSPNGVAVGDFNLDGKLDLVTANAGSPSVSILLGNGMGGFSSPTEFAIGGSGSAKVVVGDFNADGRPDLAAASGSSISILLGNGLGGFSAPNTIATGSTYRLAPGDFNADGRLDLVLLDATSDTSLILLGNGMGGFSAPISFAVGADPFWVAGGDFNLDGKLDLAVANISSNNVTILLNTCVVCPPPTLTPTSQAFAANGGPSNVTITMPQACAWAATNNAASFITLTSPANGAGNGTLNFSVAVNPNPTPRSGTITINGVVFTILQGANFQDVPSNHPFHTEIGKLSARGITLGCGVGSFCPEANTTREQAAIFIERALGVFTPPPGPITPTFRDVPNSGATDYSYEFIEDFVARGITQGCATGPPRLYCPTASVTREQVAIFLLRALGVFTPPAGPTTPTFADVPNSGATGYSFEFIEELYRRGISQGCAAGPPRLYCPAAAVTRGQMAAFLVRAFNL